MSKTWLTSDLHLGHNRIVELSHRPFATIEEHDKHFASMWAGMVKPDDIVWVLGDISVEGSYKHALGILKSLPGRKRLVTGNHDQAWVGKSTFMRFLPEYQEVFEFVSPWARTSLLGVKVNLSHFPYEGDHTESDRYDMYRMPVNDRPILHGHTHASEKVTYADYCATDFVRQIHVGVDAWDYKLVSPEQLVPLLLRDDYDMEDRDQPINNPMYRSWSVVKGKIVYQ